MTAVIGAACRRGTLRFTGLLLRAPRLHCLIGITGQIGHQKRHLKARPLHTNARRRRTFVLVYISLFYAAALVHQRPSQTSAVRPQSTGKLPLYVFLYDRSGCLSVRRTRRTSGVDCHGGKTITSVERSTALQLWQHSMQACSPV